MARKTAFSVALSDEHREYLQQIAVRERITEGEVIRRVIEEHQRSAEAQQHELLPEISR